ncbi:MAG: ECF-type sigma factor [Planctomycetota bacterium]
MASAHPNNDHDDAPSPSRKSAAKEPRNDENAGEATPAVTLLLGQLRDGHAPAADELFRILYDELHRIAGRVFGDRGAQHTLQPTALVHEAYLKMARPGGSGWNDRAHFCNVAARAMRQVLVNHARDKKAVKRGGDAVRENVTLSAFSGHDDAVDVLALHEELQALAQLDERQAKIAELRLFADLGTKDIADLLGMPQRTVQLDWQMAKSWLAERLQR